MKSQDMMKALTPEEVSGDASGSATSEENSPTFFLPLRFLGMGLLIAWLCCTHVVSIFPGTQGASNARDVIDMTMRFSDIGTFLILALLARRIGSLAQHRLICGIAVVVTTAGTLLLGLVLVPLEFPDSVIRLCSILTAVGGAFLFCLWAEAYSQMGPVRIMVYGALSCITAFLAYLLISTMMQPYAIIATATLPLISFGCVMLSFLCLPSEQRTPGKTRYPIPWKLFLLMAIAGLLSGLSGALLPNLEGYGAIHRVQVTGLAGIAILIMVFTLKEKCDARFLAKVCLPIAVIAFAIIPFAGPIWGYAVSFLVKFAYVWFTFFVLIMLANLVYRFELPSLRLFAVARAVSESAILIGVFLREPLRSSGWLENDLIMYATTIAGLILLLICALIWMREKSVNADWGAAGLDIESGLHIPGPRERLLDRNEQLSQRYGLTARETEILGLLAQRKSRSDIEQELFLSTNTIKTHTRNLYGKLGIHSKEEVYELFEYTTSSKYPRE